MLFVEMNNENKDLRVRSHSIFGFLYKFEQPSLACKLVLCLKQLCFHLSCFLQILDILYQFVFNGCNGFMLVRLGYNFDALFVLYRRVFFQLTELILVGLQCEEVLPAQVLWACERLYPCKALLLLLKESVSCDSLNVKRHAILFFNESSEFLSASLMLF